MSLEDNFANLRISRAKNFFDFLYTRKLRNSVRQNMTTSSKKIAYLQQLLFFLHTPPNILLYIVKLGKKRVGYLLLRKEEKTTYITEAIEKNYRGLGIGSKLITFSKEICGNLTAEILITNSSSIALHKKNGFILLEQTDRVVIYVYKTLSVPTAN